MSRVNPGAERPRAPVSIAGTVDSAVQGLVWPVLPRAGVMATLALHEQFLDSEWWSPERLAAMQYRQLAALLGYARRTVPHYRRVLPGSGGVGEQMLRALPILKRAQAQEDPASLASNAVPRAHRRYSRCARAARPDVRWNSRRAR